jgi:hypothetical protein
LTPLANPGSLSLEDTTMKIAHAQTGFDFAEFRPTLFPFTPEAIKTGDEAAAALEHLAWTAAFIEASPAPRLRTAFERACTEAPCFYAASHALDPLAQAIREFTGRYVNRLICFVRTEESIALDQGHRTRSTLSREDLLQLVGGAAQKVAP